jgi:hypothetical protein
MDRLDATAAAVVGAVADDGDVTISPPRRAERR